MKKDRLIFKLSGLMVAFFAQFSLAQSYPVYAGCESPKLSFSKTIYIDPVKGNDSGNGSSSSPFKTLANVVNAKKLSANTNSVLYPGNHGAVSMSKSNSPQLVNPSSWVHLEFQAGAKVNSLNLAGLNRLLITGALLSNSSGTLLTAAGMKNFVLADSTLTSSSFTNPASLTADQWLLAPRAIKIKESVCSAFLRNTVSITRMGIEIIGTYTQDSPQANSTKTLLEGNTIMNFNEDAVRLTSSDILFIRNRIQDVYATPEHQSKLHSDGIQLFTFKPNQVFDNIVIQDNVIRLSTDMNRKFINMATHGIGHFDGKLSNLKIIGNEVHALTYHGITSFAPQGCEIANNTLVNIRSNVATSIPRSWIQITKSKSGVLPKNCVVRNNVAHEFSAAGGVSLQNNIAYSKNKSLADYFQSFNVGTSSFNLNPRVGGPLHNKGVGAY